MRIACFDRKIKSKIHKLVLVKKAIGIISASGGDL